MPDALAGSATRQGFRRVHRRPERVFSNLVSQFQPESCVILMELMQMLMRNTVTTHPGTLPGDIIGLLQ